MNRNINVLKNALDLLKSYLDTYATDNQDFVYHQLAIEALSEIEKCEPLTDTYVQVVPDKCDRIVYKNRYYSLDLLTSPQPREWEGLTYKDKVDLRENNDWYNFPNDLIEATEAKCKQLNTKG